MTTEDPGINHVVLCGSWPGRAGFGVDRNVCTKPTEASRRALDESWLPDWRLASLCRGGRPVAGCPQVLGVHRETPADRYRIEGEIGVPPPARISGSARTSGGSPNSGWPAGGDRPASPFGLARHPPAAPRRSPHRRAHGLATLLCPPTPALPTSTSWLRASRDWSRRQAPRCREVVWLPSGQAGLASWNLLMSALRSGSGSATTAMMFSTVVRCAGFADQ